MTGTPGFENAHSDKYNRKQAKRAQRGTRLPRSWPWVIFYVLVIPMALALIVALIQGAFGTAIVAALILVVEFAVAFTVTSITRRRRTP